MLSPTVLDAGRRWFHCAIRTACTEFGIRRLLRPRCRPAQPPSPAPRRARAARVAACARRLVLRHRCQERSEQCTEERWLECALEQRRRRDQRTLLRLMSECREGEEEEARTVRGVQRRLSSADSDAPTRANMETPISACVLSSSSARFGTQIFTAGAAGVGAEGAGAGAAASSVPTTVC
jgi:hypothetical protein